MHNKRIYLAVPYTHTDANVQKQRFVKVTEKANEFMNKGALVYSPITHGHTIAEYGNVPGDFDFWKAHCLSFLTNWAQELYVFQLEGWEISKGVIAEIQEANTLGIPITFIE